MAERLQKLMSQWGVASRRKSEQMIIDGRVHLNGTVAVLGQKADPNVDRVDLDGVSINPTSQPKPLFVLVHKPLGVVSTCHDPQQRSTILDLLPHELTADTGLHPVGRLDVNSTGALLLTNHGQTTFVLTHPRHTVPKKYNVWVKGKPSQYSLRQWQQGVMLSRKLTLPAEVSVVKSDGDETLLRVVLCEGRNRQIRRIAEMLGHPVVKLHRVAVGPIQLGTLPRGHYRLLSSSEIKFLHQQVQEFKVLASAERTGRVTHLRGQRQ
ncbi:MAG: rRNA pseudouridine synthase [Merismopedia sp. SIO2A8]|nr:rRNA pseudouridine synthase [Symploca sp. SIO2B6]NET48607.1 rRNA pseudouridine synthase [Merismopedia sp. SIO2A8]